MYAPGVVGSPVTVGWLCYSGIMYIYIYTHTLIFCLVVLLITKRNIKGFQLIYIYHFSVLLVFAFTLWIFFCYYFLVSWPFYWCNVPFSPWQHYSSEVCFAWYYHRHSSLLLIAVYTIYLLPFFTFNYI